MQSVRDYFLQLVLRTIRAGRPAAAKSRRSAASRPQWPQSVAFGLHVRLHADNRAAAFGAFASARPYGQGRQFAAAFGHDGEQVECDRVAAVDGMQIVVQLYEYERHRLCHPLQVPGGGHGDGDARRAFGRSDEHAIGQTSVRHAGADLVNAARLRGGAGQVHHAGELQEGFEELLCKISAAGSVRGWCHISAQNQNIFPLLVGYLLYPIFLIITFV